MLQAAGEEAGEAAGLTEAAKHNVLTLSQAEVEAVRAGLAECGSVAGREAGAAAGERAGAAIDLARVTQEATAAAVHAAEQVLGLLTAGQSQLRSSCFVGTRYAVNAPPLPCRLLDWPPRPEPRRKRPRWRGWPRQQRWLRQPKWP